MVEVNNVVAAVDIAELLKDNQQSGGVLVNNFVVLLDSYNIVEHFGLDIVEQLNCSHD